MKGITGKGLLALLLGICLLLAGCVGPPAQQGENTWPDYDRMWLQTVEGSVFSCRAMCKELEMICDDPAARERALGLFRDISAQMDHGLTRSNLVYSAYTCQPRDDLLQTYERLRKDALEIQDILFQAGALLLDSPHREAFCAELNSETLQEQMQDYQPRTSQQVKLQEQEAALVSEYQSIYTGYRYEKFGKSWTLASALETMQQDPDFLQHTRQEYEQLLFEIDRGFSQALGEVLCRLMQVRNRIAADQGYDNYYDMVWTQGWQRDYAYEDFLQVAKNIKAAFSRDSREWYVIQSVLAQSIPVDLDGRQILQALGGMESLPPSLRETALALLDGELLLEGGEGAFQGAYCAALYDYDAVLIYTPRVEDVWGLYTLAHELGHGANGKLAAASALKSSVTPIEVSELQSQCTELLWMQQFASLCPGYEKEAELYELCALADNALLYQAMLSELERRLYAEPQPDFDAMCDMAAGIYASYYQVEPDTWRGWAQITHFAESPGYVVGYVMSGAAAMLLYLESLSDPAAALEKYEEILKEEEISFWDLVEKYRLHGIFTSSPYEKMAQLIRQREQENIE